MKKVIRIVIILAVLGVAGLAVAVIIQKNRDKNNKVTEQVSVVVQDPFSSQPSQQPSPEVLPLPTVAVGAMPTPSPLPSPDSDAPTTFTSAAGIKIAMSAAWRPQEKVDTGMTYTVFYNAEDSIVATIESYSNSGDSIDIIEQQLRSSSMVSNIQKTTVASYAALMYDTNQGPMLVVVRNNTTHYISGQLAKDLSKISF